MVSSNNKNNASNVLVADDQAITRELLVRAISTQGYSVDSSANGENALQLWLEKKHGLVITDCHMPIKDGYQLSQDIRNAERLSGLDRTLIIAWTANTKEEEQQKCMNAGMDDFLSKPINFSQLKQLLSGIKPSGHTHYSSVDLTNQGIDINANIDFTILKQVAEDTISQGKVIKDLLNYIKRDYKLLEQHFAAHDLTKSQDLAHRLKGACRMVGANKVAAAFANIENLNASTYPTESQQLLNHLNQAINQLEQFSSSDTNPILAGN